MKLAVVGIENTGRITVACETGGVRGRKQMRLTSDLVVLTKRKFINRIQNISLGLVSDTYPSGLTDGSSRRQSGSGRKHGTSYIVRGISSHLISAGLPAGENVSLGQRRSLYHVQRRSSIIHPMIAFRITITSAHKQDTLWCKVQPA
ncbi:hypothetical protein CBL_06111 [Carabus blaptoides fortunei]